MKLFLRWVLMTVGILMLIISGMRLRLEPKAWMYIISVMEFHQHDSLTTVHLLNERGDKLRTLATDVEYGFANYHWLDDGRTLQIGNSIKRWFQWPGRELDKPPAGLAPTWNIQPVHEGGLIFGPLPESYNTNGGYYIWTADVSAEDKYLAWWAESDFEIIDANRHIVWSYDLAFDQHGELGHAWDLRFYRWSPVDPNLIFIHLSYLNRNTDPHESGQQYYLVDLEAFRNGISIEEMRFSMDDVESDFINVFWTADGKYVIVEDFQAYQHLQYDADGNLIRQWPERLGLIRLSHYRPFTSILGQWALLEDEINNALILYDYEHDEIREYDKQDLFGDYLLFQHVEWSPFEQRFIIQVLNEAEGQSALFWMTPDGNIIPLTEGKQNFQEPRIARMIIPVNDNPILLMIGGIFLTLSMGILSLRKI